MSKPPKTASRSRYVTSTMSGERVQAFVPAPLPPDGRTLDLASLQGILAEANQAVGRLDGMTSAFPDLNLFLYSPTSAKRLCCRLRSKEHSLRSPTSCSTRMLRFPAFPLMTCRRYRTTVAALNHGLKRLRGGFPLSLRLIREIHEVLLSKGARESRSAWRVPQESELDWRIASGERRLCAAAAGVRHGLPGRFGDVPP